MLAAVAVNAACPCSAAAEGPAIGQFELKDLEAGADHLQFQSQNAYSWGQPRRETAAGAGAGLLFDGNSVTEARAALEVEKGLTRFLKFRVGIEYEKERVDDPHTLAEANAFDGLKLTEVGGELIAIWMPRDGDGFGWGSVVEAEHPVGGVEMNSVVYGQIFELAHGPWFAALQPMVVQHFGGAKDEGASRDNKWDFAYAAQVLYTASSAWTFGVEAYGTVDRIGSTGHRDEAGRLFGDFDQHRLGPIVYYSLPLRGPAGKAGTARKDDGDDQDDGPTATIGVGFFAGLTGNTPDGTAKLSIEVDF
jgi:hypothetical protein